MPRISCDYKTREKVIALDMNRLLPQSRLIRCKYSWYIWFSQSYRASSYAVVAIMTQDMTKRNKYFRKTWRCKKDPGYCQHIRRQTWKPNIQTRKQKIPQWVNCKNSYTWCRNQTQFPGNIIAMKLLTVNINLNKAWLPLTYFWQTNNQNRHIKDKYFVYPW